MYKEFAYVYDKLTEDIDYKAWAQYFLSFKKDARRILDLGCGTGSIAKYFLEQGKSLTCLDISEDMLSQASNKLKAYSNIKFIKANMVNYLEEDSYDLIVSACDGVNYLIEPGELDLLLRNSYKNLKENGLLILEFSSAYKLKNILANNTFINEENNIFYTWENFLDEEEGLVEFYLNFFIEKSPGIYKRFDEYHCQKIYDSKNITDRLRFYGFEDIKVYETLSLRPIKANSERITIVAKK